MTTILDALKENVGRDNAKRVSVASADLRLLIAAAEAAEKLRDCLSSWDGELLVKGNRKTEGRLALIALHAALAELGIPLP